MKQFDSTKEFGDPDAWQININQIKNIQTELVRLNENNYNIYEEQIEDIILVLGKLKYLKINNNKG